MKAPAVAVLSLLTGTFLALPAPAETPPEELFSWSMPHGVTDIVAHGGSLYIADMEHVYRHSDSRRLARSHGDIPAGPNRLSVRHDGMVYASAGFGGPTIAWLIGVFTADLQLDHSMGHTQPAPPFHVWGMTHDAQGNLYVADGEARAIHKFDPNDRLILTWGSDGSGPGQFRYLSGMATTPNGDILVCDYENERIQKFDTEGNYLGELRGDPSWVPYDVAVDRQGRLYVMDIRNRRVVKLAGDGAVITQWAVAETRTVAVDDAGFVYVGGGSDSGRIHKFDNKPGRVARPRFQHDPALLLHVETIAEAFDCDHWDLDPQAIATSAAVDLEGEDSYRVYLLAAPNTAGFIDAGITGAQLGIEYTLDDPPGSGIEVLDWRACTLMEFHDPEWPESGSNNTMTWSTNPLTCQRRDLVILGYFEMTAHAPSIMRIKPFQASGLAKIANCDGAEEVVELRLDTSRLGWISLGGAAVGESDAGCNPLERPCDEFVTVKPTTWGGLKLLLGTGR